MLQKALVLAFILASIASCIGCGNTANHYVYATLPAANEVGAYREDPNSGVLTQITGSPYSVGDGAHFVVLHPSGKFLYVANPGQNENDISLFTIASNGDLNEVTPRTSVAPGTLPQFMAMDPAGGFLYVANVQSANISVFSINASSGVLTQIAGSPFQINVSPLNMQLTPSGKYLYVTAPGEQTGVIEGFSVNAGILQFISQTVTGSVNANPYGLAIDPSSTYLYAANTTNNSISIFTINSGSSGVPGTLTEVSGSPFDDIYEDPIALIVDPSGQFLYVANQVSNNVAVYSITSSTGFPVALTTSTTTFAFTTETSPSVMALDPSGKYLFVGNQGSSAGIEAFSVSSGNLTYLYTYAVGNTPSSIAVLQ
jgi:6-phosphogluconolactonase